MAKKSLIARNDKRKKLVSKYFEKRLALKKEIMSKTELDFQTKVQLSAKLAALPRNSSKTRINNRCFVTGRAHGYCGYFGISRIILRSWASFGLLAGVCKKSL